MHLSEIPHFATFSPFLPRLVSDFHCNALKRFRCRTGNIIQCNESGEGCSEIVFIDTLMAPWKIEGSRVPTVNHRFEGVSTYADFYYLL